MQAKVLVPATTKTEFGMVANVLYVHLPHERKV